MSSLKKKRPKGKTHGKYSVVLATRRTHILLLGKALTQTRGCLLVLGGLYMLRDQRGRK